MSQATPASSQASNVYNSGKFTTNTGGNSFLERVYGVGSVEDCRALYDEWAETFDNDVNDPSQDYVAPTFVAQAVLAADGDINGTCFDAGCGTGLSGVSLAKVGAKTIDGVDLSPGMLKVAEKTGVYRDLATADLSKPIDKPSDTYDVVICVGTLTHGHVGPDPALKEFMRITKKGGVMVATILNDIWESVGYKAETERLKDEGTVEIVSTAAMDYRRGAGVKAVILVLRKK